MPENLNRNGAASPTQGQPAPQQTQTADRGAQAAQSVADKMAKPAK